MNEEKLYGIFPGNLKNTIQEKLYKMNEEETFKLIYYIESEIFWMTHEDRNFLIDNEEMVEINYALEYVIYSTRRFGIKFKTPSINHLEINNDYLNWYQQWNNLLLKNKINYIKIKR